MENIKPELTCFLPARSDSPLKILAVGREYLFALREKFPRAELYAVADENDSEFISPDGEYLSLADICRSLDVRLTFLDIYAEPLPYAQDFFDYIISDLTLEKAVNPQDIAAGFGTFLKPTGAWLTSFRNIRHWSVLEDLAQGHYYNVVSRLFAKQEFERLLYASFYKEVRFRPQKRAGKDNEAAKFAAAGFDNRGDDLNTEFWLVCAARSMPELALLKSMYDADTRKLLSRIIHRIEYDVNADEETVAFWRLCAAKGIFADYAAAFVEQTVFHHQRFYERLARYTGRAYRQNLLDVTAAAIRESLNDETKTYLVALLGRLTTGTKQE